MLTLSRLSAVLDLTNPTHTLNKRYQLILLSPDGGIVYSACHLPVETKMTNHAILGTLSSLIIMENPGVNNSSWAGHRKVLQQANGNHKVRYIGKLRASANISGYLTPFSALIRPDTENKRFQLSTFSQALPKVKLHKESVLILNDHIWTASGNWAGVDLILTIIEEESGTTEAMHMMNVIEQMFIKYENNSQLAILQSFSRHGNSDRINRSLRYIRENLSNTVTITQLAELANLSPRQFSRLFKEETGTSPAKAVAQIRAEVARQHVIQGRLSLDKIAQHCGFSGTKSMRRAFLKFFGESPCHFRPK